MKKGGEAVYFLVRCNVNAKMKKKNNILCMSIGFKQLEMLIMRNANALLVMVADASMMLLNFVSTS